jgi:hypothetical protein
LNRTNKCNRRSPPNGPHDFMNHFRNIRNKTRDSYTEVEVTIEPEARSQLRLIDRECP